MIRRECKFGEIWVKFDSKEEYDEKREEMMACMIEDPYDMKFDTCGVRVYIKSTRSVQQFWRYSYESLKNLQEKFGVDNVKFIHKETRNVYITQFTDSENIERIADALERIANTLERGRRFGEDCERAREETEGF